MKNILIPVSPGELLDKITILEIKSERIGDPKKLANIRLELQMLRKIWSDSLTEDNVIADLHRQLKAVNAALWDIEDDIRDEEQQKCFGERFIELARSVYITNDKRALAKKNVNLHLGSEIVEEKSYKNYS